MSPFPSPSLVSVPAVLSKMRLQTAVIYNAITTAADIRIAEGDSRNTYYQPNWLNEFTVYETISVTSRLSPPFELAE